MLRPFVVAVAFAATLTLTATAQPPAGFRMMEGGPFLMAMLVQSPKVQQELKLTDEQRQKLQELVEQLREKMRGAGQKLREAPPEERQKQLQAMREEVEKQLATVLNERQGKRLKQIALQVEGYAALGRPEVAKQVGLTEEQTLKVRDVLQQAREKGRELFQQRPPDRQAIRQKLQEIRRWVDEQIQPLLTDEQKKKWQELVGEPFKLEQLFGFGRRFGNRRGQRGA